MSTPIWLLSRKKFEDERRRRVCSIVRDVLAKHDGKLPAAMLAREARIPARVIAEIVRRCEHIRKFQAPAPNRGNSDVNWYSLVVADLGRVALPPTCP